MKRKKLYKLIIFIFLGIMALPALGYFLLKTPKLQNLLVQKLTTELSESLQTKISFEHANIGLFNKLVLDNFYVEDFKKDTLLFTEKLTVGIKRFNQKERILDIQRIKLKNSKINFRMYDDELNLKFIIDEIKKNSKRKSKKERLDITINNITIEDSYFILQEEGSSQVTGRINFTDLSVGDLNLDISKLKIDDGDVSFDIESLSFKEKTGLTLEELTAQMNIGSDHMNFEELAFETSKSELREGFVRFSFETFKDFVIDSLYDKVNLNIKLVDANLNSNDIAYFSRSFRSLNEQIVFFGELSGRLGNLKGKDIILRVGDDSYIATNFSINGLPDFKTAFIHLNVDNLLTTPNAVEKIASNLSRHDIQPFAKTIEELGRIKFKGSFTGFVEDFVTYGTFNTELGTIKTDLLFRPLGNRFVEYSGKLSTNEFIIGKVIPNNKGLVGAITIDGDIKGKSGPGNKIDATLNTMIAKLELNNYSYKNIKVVGNWSDTYFNGDINVNDPNLEMDFSGKVDYGKELSNFNFRATVTEANLFALNIDKKDSASFASFIVNANGTGKNLDEFNGKIELIQSYFEKTNKQIQLYDVSFVSENTLDSSKISLRSDFVDASLIGKYKFKQLKESIKQLINFYLPSTFSDIDTKNILNENNFHCEGVFKNTSAFTNFFIPELSLGDNTTFNLKFYPGDSIFVLNAFSSFLSYKDYLLENITINSYSEDNKIRIESGSKELRLNNVIFENFTMLMDAQNDSLSFTSRWHNWDEKLYKGTLSAHCNVYKPENKINPVFRIEIPKTEVVMGDSIWTINEGIVYVDSSFINVNNAGFSRKEQKFAVSGDISKDPKSKLELSFANFNMGNFNILSKGQNLKLEGILDGTGEIFDVYENFSFDSKLFVKELGINSELVGNTEFIANYKQQRKVIEVLADSKRGKLKTINIEGEYYPSNKIINFNIGMNKLKLELFSPYVEGVFSDLSGLASGDLKLRGKLREPVMNGEIELDKASFIVNYINTRYNFSDDVKIERNNILFNDINIFDLNSSTAVLNGSINSRYLKDFDFDLDVAISNFQCLNNDYSISPNFYGEAFATGNVKIVGNHRDLTFNVNATTNQNTNVFIPFESDDVVTTYDFVEFVDNTIEVAPEEQEERETAASESGINLNLDLEVTPGAEVQLIFDSKMGNIIRGRGYGDLKITYDKYQNLSMYGDYNITEGDYLFTLQNIINKKFRIEEGGYVSWNGDPADANINLKAVYTTKTSLSSLYPDGYLTSVTQSSGTSSNYNKRVPVECQLFLTDKLENPSIDFGIYLPTADADAKRWLEDAINTKDELSKQFLSLLVINSFMAAQNNVQSAEAQTSGAGAIGVTTSELLSNQVSNWLSQFSNDFDVGVNYRPDDGISSEELELALSTKILNDRVNISGNLEVGGQYKTTGEQQNTNKIVGDFDVDVKISKSGKLRVKAYNKANDNLFFDSEYTQGIGVFYREEFDSFEELFEKYLAKLSSKEKIN